MWQHIYTIVKELQPVPKQQLYVHKLLTLYAITYVQSQQLTTFSCESTLFVINETRFALFLGDKFTPHFGIRKCMCAG